MLRGFIEWSKKTNTELATRVPLIIRVPWLADSIGARTPVHAELVDLYRTLVDLAGLNASSIQADVQGMSLAPVFLNPAALPPELVSKPAYSQIGSCACREYTKGNWTGLECDAGRCFETPTNSSSFNWMGYSDASSDGWRFTLWAAWDAGTQRVDFGKPTHAELYDQRGAAFNFDFDGYAHNVAAIYPARVASMRAELIAAVTAWY